MKEINLSSTYFHTIDYIETNPSGFEFFLVFILVLCSILLIGMLIYLSSSSSKAVETTYDGLSPRVNPDNNCDHDWKEDDVSYTCGYKVRAGEHSCCIKKPVTLRCSKCGELRCRTHAQKHYRFNAGGAFKGDKSP